MNLLKKKQNLIMIVIIAIIAVVAIGVGVKLHHGSNATNNVSSGVEQEGSMLSEELQIDTKEELVYKDGMLQKGSGAQPDDEAVINDTEQMTNDDQNVSVEGNKPGTGTSNTNSATNTDTSDKSSASGLNSNSNAGNSSAGNNSINNSGNSGSNTGSSSGSDTAVTPPQEDTLTCYITIRCDTILNNMDKLASGHESFVPSSGYLLNKKAITFTDGETAFDITKRACANAGLSIEYSWAAIYDSYYIEGINNLHEFDCGDDSGWMYKVNGWFPNYGCSKYEIKDGDNIVWCYTCEGLGADVGASK